MRAGIWSACQEDAMLFKQFLSTYYILDTKLGYK